MSSGNQYNDVHLYSDQCRGLEIGSVEAAYTVTFAAEVHVMKVPNHLTGSLRIRRIIGALFI